MSVVKALFEDRLTPQDRSLLPYSIPPITLLFVKRPTMLIADVFTSNLMAARYQMAFTLGFHIILACFGVGLPVLMLFVEWRFIRTGDPLWRVLAQRWSKAFAVLFAIGAVSGTVLSFELGLLWPELMGRFGSVIGLPFTMEGFAFFMEAIFAGIYLYGWDRLPPRLHCLTGVPIAIAGFLSAAFVVTANAWMNSPTGFRLEDGQPVDIQPIAAMLSPSSGAQVVHMLLAAYMVTGFSVAGFYAFSILRGRETRYHQRAIAVALGLAVIATPLQMAAGDWSAKVVAKTQPLKLAAMEGHYHTETGAPLLIGGLPDDEAEKTRFAIKVPKLLSFLAYGDANAEVRGMTEWPTKDRPPTVVVHIAFQLMVACGTYCFALTAWITWTYLRKKRLPKSRRFLTAVVFSGPLAILAIEAGWTVTEVGRQPWIVYEIMRTSDAVTGAPGIWTVFLVTLSIYGILGVCTVVVLRLLAHVPLPEETTNNE